MTDALVSIVMPCFNTEKWLRPAVRSILAQSYSNIELIAVDDGSQDSTAEILRGFALLDDRVKLVRLERNAGIVVALNRGLEHCSGAYIGRMDADDISLPGRIGKQVDFLSTTGTDLCGTWFQELGQGPRRTVAWPTDPPSVHAALLFQNAICHPSVLARREVFDRYRYRDDFRLAEDYDLFSRAIGTFILANIPDTLLLYRRHPAQATQAKRAEMELVTRRIRAQALLSAGLTPSKDELEAHNMIRAPQSILDIHSLKRIESWLVHLLQGTRDQGARHVIASQWIRACIRAAPLGPAMMRTFRESILSEAAAAGPGTRLDLQALALLKLDYQSKVFSYLRRFGISA